MIIGQKDIQKIVFRGKFLPADQNLFDLVQAVRRGGVSADPADVKMRKLEDAFEFISVLPAGRENAFFGRFRFADRV